MVRLGIVKEFMEVGGKSVSPGRFTFLSLYDAFVFARETWAACDGVLFCFESRTGQGNWELRVLVPILLFCVTLHLDVSEKLTKLAPIASNILGACLIAEPQALLVTFIVLSPCMFYSLEEY